MTEPVHGIAEALLVLADGTVFEGEAIGAPPPDGVQTGEVVFNTVLCGYQEVITDPSYAGQAIARPETTQVVSGYTTHRLAGFPGSMSVP